MFVSFMWNVDNCKNKLCVCLCVCECARVWWACVMFGVFIVCSEKNKKSHYFQVYLRRKKTKNTKRVCVCARVYI